jgi:cell division protein FtsL
MAIPLLLGLDAWQAERYARLEAITEDLADSQRDWLESNKRLVAGIAVLSAPERIEAIARDQLGLRKAAPEDVLQIVIARGGGLDG